MRILVYTIVALCLLHGALGHDEADHHKGHKHLRPSRHAHTTFEEFAAEHLTWLSDDERAEVRKLHDAGDKEKAREKVLEILEASTGDKQAKGAAQLQAACRELIVTILGEDTAKELKTLKESGTSDDELSKKIDGLLDAVTDEQKKQKAKEHKYVCKKVYSIKAASKKRRHAAHHDLEQKLRNEWAWLTTEQKDEVRKLKNDGKNDEFLLSKVFEYFKSADDKDKAEDGLQTSCSGAILTILGPEKAEELKTFMANGAKPEAYEAKVKELLGSAPKKTLTKNQESCKTVFTSASRRRRHEGHHHKTLEDYLQSHLSWLSEAQKAEVVQLKKDGKTPAELQEKIMQYYEATEGDAREKASSALKSGCEEVLAHLLTKEQFDEIKKLRETGTSPNDVSAKISEFVKTVTDEDKLKEAKKYEANCKKLFGVTARKRRHDHHHHTLEDYLESSHLAWLTDSQKETLRKLKQEGKGKDVIQKQVLDYFENTSGDVREKATAGLQAGCRELFAHLVGAEKVGEIKQLKESGATNEELRNKANQLIEAITDEKTKEEAKFYAVGCRKAFGVENKRKRHTHHRSKRDAVESPTLDELFKTHLSWLTEDQQKTLTQLKADGKSRDELQAKVLEFYEGSTDDVKQVAREKMQDGCRILLVKVLGEEKANELKTLRDNGTPLTEIAEKTTNWINELTDEDLKKSAQNYSTVCNKAFNLQ